MEKKFRVLRIIGTLWKALAWIALIGGVLASLGILLAGVLGSGGFLLSLFQQETGITPGAAVGVVGSILAFIFALATTVVYFLILYAVGELIYLMLAIEENTRQTMRLMQRDAHTGTESPTSASPPSP
jgi:uncharacterized membrane protein